MSKDGVIEINTSWPDTFMPEWTKLKEATSENIFGLSSFELLKEASIITLLAASIFPEKTDTRNDAILSALVLKAAKLSKAVVAMSSDLGLGADRQLALLRELLEEVSILKYLLEDPGSGERFELYVNNSIASEKAFLETIKLAVKNRGSTLKLEESMSASIFRTAAAAGVDLYKLPTNREIKWPHAEKLIFDAFGSLIYPAYRGGSSVIHTTWTDLFSHYLTQDSSNKFHLDFDDSPPRPQPLYAAGILLIDVLRQYLSKFRPEGVGEFYPKLDDLYGRLSKVADVHGKWQDNKRTVSK